MDLFDVKARGFGHPLNSREISHLVRAGYLDQHTHCRPRGETRWERIEVFFPLLAYGVGTYDLPRPQTTTGRHLFVLALACLLIVAGGAFYFSNRPASAETASLPGSTARPPAAAAVALVRN